MARLRTKNIPTADSDVLRSTRDELHHTLHTPEGLHAFDEPRRALVERGMRARAIHEELASREVGYYNPCRFCSGVMSSQFNA